MFFLRLSAAILCIAPTAALAEDFSIAFTWDGLKLCNTGWPNIVSNPEFDVKGLPEGTVGIQFKLTDLDNPGYNHGGGWAEIAKDGKIPPGAFRYESPCPPTGQNTYEWTATARTKKGFGGKKLGVAKARRPYP